MEGIFLPRFDADRVMIWDSWYYGLSIVVLIFEYYIVSSW